MPPSLQKPVLSILANQAASFIYADPSGLSRSFIALKDDNTGFNANKDAIVDITGYTCLLANQAVV
jgi:hypothetical protein